MKLTILGAGKSGISAATLAHSLGDLPFVSEFQPLPPIQVLDTLSIPYETGGHSDRIYEADCLVLSPGIKKELPIVQSFYQRNIPVISEIEYAFTKTKQPCIGITGSNGKTTTTTLLGRMLEHEFSGKRIAGNIGIPLSDVVDVNDLEPIAIELSSFQLETIDQFSPKTAVLLNVSPNHLDWYNTYDEYVDAKLNLLKHIDRISHVIVNADDKVLNERTTGLGKKRMLFSLLRTDVDAFIEDGFIKFRLDKEIQLVQISELKCKGPHHLMNMMAASLSAYLNGVSLKTIRQILCTFEDLEHRIEYVGSFHERRFYNDSKSTSVEALKMALQSFDEPVILLAGGKHKGASYSEVKELIEKNTKKIYVFGAAKNIMYDEWKDVSSIEMVETLFDALDSIAIKEEKGIVLLSPACSSFDQFKSFEDRGTQYKSYVKKVFHG